jgi:hypothetical protein
MQRPLISLYRHMSISRLKKDMRIQLTVNIH